LAAHASNEAERTQTASTQWDDEKSRLEEQIAALTAQVTALEIEKQDLLVNSTARLQEVTSALEAEKQQLENRVTELVAEVDNVKTTAKSKIASALEKAKELRSEAVSSKQQEIDALNASIGDVSATVDSMKASLSECKAAVESLTAEKNSLASSLAEKCHQIESLQGQIASMSENSTTSRAGVDVLGATVAQLEADKQELSNRMAEQATQLQEAQERVQSLTVDIEDVKANAKSKVSNAIEKIKEFKAAIDAKNSELEIANARISELEIALHSVRMGALETSEQHQHATDSQLAAQRQQLESQIAQLTTQLSERENGLLQSSQQIANYMNEVQEIQQNYALKCEECNELLKNIVELSEQVTEANQLAAVNASILENAANVEKELVAVRKVKELAEKRLMTLQVAHEANKQSPPPSMSTSGPASIQVLARVGVPSLFDNRGGSNDSGDSNDVVWCMLRMEKSKAELDAEKLMVRLTATTIGKQTGPQTGGGDEEPPATQTSTMKERIAAAIAAVQTHKIEWRPESEVLGWFHAWRASQGSEENGAESATESTSSFSIGKSSGRLSSVNCIICFACIFCRSGPASDRHATLCPRRDEHQVRRRESHFAA
jgi:chromosome segregation ATPase